MAVGANAFTRRDITITEVPGRQPMTKLEVTASSTAWRIGRDTAESEGYRPRMQRCIFHAEKKLLCRNQGFYQIFPSADDNTAVAYGYEDRDIAEPSRVIVALHKSGRVINKWEEPGLGLIHGEATRSGNLFAAIRDSTDGVDVIVIGLDGVLRWQREFKGVDFRSGGSDGVHVTADGRFIVATFNRGMTYVFNQTGALKTSFERLGPAMLSPDHQWAAICGSEKVVVYEFETGKTLFESPPPTKDDRFFSCNDVSHDGEKLLIAERVRLNASRTESTIERIYIVDLKKRVISTAVKHVHPSYLQFDATGYIRAESSLRADEVFQINE